MGHIKAVGFCPRCEKIVQLSCPVPFHLLHLIFSLMTRGLWLIVWSALIARSCFWRCRECGSRIRRSGNRITYPTASFSQPWLEERFVGVNRGSRPDFNTQLIQKGLVFYAATRSMGM